MADRTPPSSLHNTPMQPLGSGSEESSASPPAQDLGTELETVSGDEGMEVDPQSGESSDGDPEVLGDAGEEPVEESEEDREGEEDEQDKGKGKAASKRPSKAKAKRQQAGRKGKDGDLVESEIVDQWNQDFGDVGLSCAPPLPVTS